MRRAQQLPCRSLLKHVGNRTFSASHPSEVVGPATVRTVGYGPSKHLLRGVDATRGLVVETSLSPADAEIQRRVLSLSHPGVRVRRPGDSDSALAVGREKTEQASSRPQAVVDTMISTEHLTSVASVIVEEVKNQLEINGYASDASQDNRSASVVNTIAECLRSEIERLICATHAQEASISQMLRDNTNLICERIACGIYSEHAAGVSQEEGKRYERAMQEVRLALVNFERSMKNVLEERLTQNASSDAVPQSVQRRIISTIEESLHAQQERLSMSLEEALRRRKTDDTITPTTVSTNAIENVIKGAMAQMVDETRREVQELLQEVRSTATNKDANEASDGSVVSGSALEGMLKSFNEHLGELQESASAATDLKELTMEIHSMLQTSAGEVSEMKNLMKKLKKDLLSVLRSSGDGSPVEGSATEKKTVALDNIGVYADKLEALSDRIISTLNDRLKEQLGNVQELSARLGQLENMVDGSHRSALEESIYSQEINDDRMLALARSISESIISALPLAPAPVGEESLDVSKKAKVTVPETTLTSLPPPFTVSDVAQAVSAALTPRINELAACIQVREAPAVVAARSEEGGGLVDDRQLLTLAQTICDGVKDAVRETMALQPTLSSQHAPSTQGAVPPVDGSTGVPLGETVIQRLDAFKNEMATIIRGEMDRGQEFDMTPLRVYIDNVLDSVRNGLGEQQRDILAKVEGVVSVLTEKFKQHQELFESGADKRHREQMEKFDLLKSAQGSVTAGVQRQKNEGQVGKLPAAAASVPELFAEMSQQLVDSIRSMVTGEVSTVLSSLEGVQKEVREAARHSPTALEAKVQDVGEMLKSALASEQERGQSVQRALDEITAGIKHLQGGNADTPEKSMGKEVLSGSRVLDALKTVDGALADMAKRNTVGFADLRADFNASETRKESKSAERAEKVLRGIDGLRTEILDSKRQLEQLISSNSQNRDLMDVVAGMRAKLEQVSQSLESIEKHKVEEQKIKGGQSLQPPRTEQPDQKHSEASELFLARIDGLSATVREAIELLQQRQQAGEKTLGAPPTVDKSSTESLASMEDRLNKRLEALQNAFDEMTKVGATEVSMIEEMHARKRSSDAPGAVEDQLKDVDVLLGIVKSSRSVHIKQMLEKLTALRSFLETASLVKEGPQDVSELLKVLEENRLKLKEDVTGAEAGLLKQVNTVIEKAIERFAGTVEKSAEATMTAQVDKVRDVLKAENEKLAKAYELSVLQLQDRFGELEKSFGVSSEKLVTTLRESKTEWHTALERLPQSNMVPALRDELKEVFTEQLRVVQQRFEEQKTREEKSVVTVLSNVQDLSKSVDKLHDISGEIQSAVSRSLSALVEDLHRAQKELADHFERYVREVIERKTPQQMQRDNNVAKTDGVWVPRSASAILSSVTALPLSWLVTLSLVVAVTILLSAYLLFAAFLVTFVPARPPNELTGGFGCRRGTKLSSSRVVDQVIL